MFYLEVVHCEGNEERCCGHLLTDFTGVKQTLAGKEWVRFVATELVENKTT